MALKVILLVRTSWIVENIDLPLLILSFTDLVGLVPCLALLALTVGNLTHLNRLILTNLFRPLVRWERSSSAILRPCRVR